MKTRFKFGTIYPDHCFCFSFSTSVFSQLSLISQKINGRDTIFCQLDSTGGHWASSHLALNRLKCRFGLSAIPAMPESISTTVGGFNDRMANVAPDGSNIKLWLMFNAIDSFRTRHLKTTDNIALMRYGASQQVYDPNNPTHSGFWTNGYGTWITGYQIFPTGRDTMVSL